MIDDPQLIASFDTRENYDLVDFEIAGLPLWILTLEVRIKENSKVTLAEQALVSLIHAGMRDENELQSLLGLNVDVARFYLVELQKKSIISISEQGIYCTSKGTVLAESGTLLSTTTKQVKVLYDPITCSFCKKDSSDVLWKAFDLKHQGVRMLKPSPQRPPTPDEIDTTQLSSALKESLRYYVGLVEIVEVVSRHTRFVKSLMLIYKERHGEEVDVRFVIDSRISEAHSNGFTKQGGVLRHGIKGGVARESTIIEDNDTLDGIGDLWRRARRSERPGVGLSFNKKNRMKSPRGSKDANASREYRSQADRTILEDSKKEDTCLVSVYEHPKLLEEAMINADSQIIIISPWITDAVVDLDFLSKLEQRLIEGVEVLIGYGINGDNKPENNAVNSLQRLSINYSNFIFSKLGDTHAKILIMDSDFLVASSFNWLSFRGDPQRTFREEWGVCVRGKQKVKKEAEKFRQRIIQSTSKSERHKSFQ